jgi:hypothetical protein
MRLTSGIKIRKIMRFFQKRCQFLRRKHSHFVVLPQNLSQEGEGSCSDNPSHLTSPCDLTSSSLHRETSVTCAKHADLRKHKILREGSTRPNVDVNLNTSRELTLDREKPVDE